MPTTIICLDASFVVRLLAEVNPDSVYQQKW